MSLLSRDIGVLFSAVQEHDALITLQKICTLSSIDATRTLKLLLLIFNKNFLIYMNYRAIKSNYESRSHHSARVL